jgi:hypothetical protein
MRNIVEMEERPHVVLSRRRDRRLAHKLRTDGMCRVDMVTPSVSHKARSVLNRQRRHGERDVQFRKIWTVTMISLTSVIYWE